eukprot:CAMPEP_0174253780 /NCGR_PEP_ID=MMETSP0439-20130205/3131_1 /TAXON_ID=0 /ORGANISM="Stereomyxa ramosa, Strain Chinc5" /LENGTH=533 /DNA_ID=CAMNT_0015334993 /DNA_START=15 /DNA_END=1616 /DNA_ORIENTATION=+
MKVRWSRDAKKGSKEERKKKQPKRTTSFGSFILASGEEGRDLRQKLSSKYGVQKVYKTCEDAHFVDLPEICRLAKAMFKTIDNDAMEAFLMAFPIYELPSAPEKIFELWVECYKEELKDQVKSSLKDPVERLLQFMKYWVSYYVMDFKPKQLKELLETLTLLHPSLNGNIALSQEVMELVRDTIRNYKMKISLGAISSITTLKVYDNKSEVELAEISPKAIARGLTAIEFQMFSEVHPREFVGMAWQSEDRDILAPNVTNLVERFNIVSYWVSYEILSQKSEKLKMVMLKKMIQVAWFLFKVLRNFNALMAILAGLNHYTVATRISSIWKRLPSKYSVLVQKMNHMMSPQRNYARYKKKMKNMPFPKLPYFAPFCRDFLFIHEGNYKHSDEGAINFELPLLLFTHFKTVRSYSQHPYTDIDVKPHVIDYLRHLPTIAEEQLTDLSFSAHTTESLSSQESASEASFSEGFMGSGSDLLQSSYSSSNSSSTTLTPHSERSDLEEVEENEPMLRRLMKSNLENLENWSDSDDWDQS